MFGNKPVREADVKETPMRMPERTPERTPERPQTETVDPKTGSVFARGTRMNGTLRCDGSVRIDGEFDGNLETGDTLVVGKEGIVRANVKVKRAIIGGRLEGNIHATGKVELHSGCEVFGEVETPSLIIEEGVVFEGSCKMGSKTAGRRDASGSARDAGAPASTTGATSSSGTTSSVGASATPSRPTTPTITLAQKM